jgi:hypothetical protein
VGLLDGLLDLVVKLLGLGAIEVEDHHALLAAGVRDPDPGDDDSDDKPATC